MYIALYAISLGSSVDSAISMARTVSSLVSAQRSPVPVTPRQLYNWIHLSLTAVSFARDIDSEGINKSGRQDLTSLVRPRGHDRQIVSLLARNPAEGITVVEHP